jgi:hypothetical protein
LLLPAALSTGTCMTATAAERTAAVEVE